MSGNQALREALADKLAYWFPDSGTGQALTRDEHLAAADALLPVVEAECRRRAAEELRRMGDDFRLTSLPGPWTGAEVSYEAHARADAIEAQP